MPATYPAYPIAFGKSAILWHFIDVRTWFILQTHGRTDGYKKRDNTSSV
jgi:hypothetical protein